MNDFEYDEDKSQANLEKHGIDFQDAQALWKDPGLLEIKARSDDGPRFLAIGLIGPTHSGLPTSLTEPEEFGSFL